MNLPNDYEERVYAGVLGKIIGIYFGLPMEGWPYKKVIDRLGQFDGYTNEDPKNKLNTPMPLVNVSDDINGMFTFIRALPDNGNSKDISAADIGRTWLNNFILGKTASWWGGMCFSSEYTALVRLLSGVEAPKSGSIELNGKVTAQQIGGRIFVDSWPMVAPGNPELAADLARKAAGVSHDGESIYGAQLVAVMESQAFVENNLDTLFDVGLEYIPKDSLIYEVTQKVREWHAGDGDWKHTHERIYAQYGYDKFGGGCHIVPNHALVVLGLLYGNNDFRKSMVITATAGWDTDCNCSAVGCILGIKDGLDSFKETPDLRFPIEDRLYTSTSESGRSITDAVIESYEIINIGRSLAGQPPVKPKNGARFHFELPGSVQCFRAEKEDDSSGEIKIENVEGNSESGNRSLAVRFNNVTAKQSARVSTATFTIPEALPVMNPRGGETPRKGWLYRLIASPTLYSGQTIQARVTADPADNKPIQCALYIRHYIADNKLHRIKGPSITLQPGQDHTFTWQAPDTEGQPIAEVGFEISSPEEASGNLYLDYLTWDGTPNVVFHEPKDNNNLWRKAWAPAIDRPQFQDGAIHLRQNLGKGLMIQGTRDWTNYAVSAALSSHWARNFGVCARVQGSRRYYALLIGGDQSLRIVKMRDTETVLAKVDFSWEEMHEYEMRFEVNGNTLTGIINGKKLIQTTDTDCPLENGGIALILEEGHLRTDAVAVTPLDKEVSLEPYRQTDGDVTFLPKNW